MASFIFVCEDPLSIESLQQLLVCSSLTSQPQLSGELQTFKCEDLYGNLSDQVRSVNTWGKIFKIYDKKWNGIQEKK